MIANFDEPKKVRDTFIGKQMIKRKDELLQKIKEFSESR